MPKIKAREIKFHCQAHKSGTERKTGHRAKVRNQQNWKNGKQAREQDQAWHGGC